MRWIAAVVSIADVPALADVQLGPRPHFLVDTLPAGALKERFSSCAGPYTRRLFSIAHRGAPLLFPKHTREGYVAAARMGACVIECDVTFTADLELVCRHSQAGLHSSTDILATPLAEKCTLPFQPASGGRDAKAECRTSDLTLGEFRLLKGKMNGVDADATTLAAYMAGTAPWRTDLYGPGTLMTHAESIALFRDLGVKFTPELKTPKVSMPFHGFTMRHYAMKLIEEYRAAGIPPGDVWVQSFDLDIICLWIKEAPEFGRQAVYLMDEYRRSGYDPDNPATWPHSMAELKAMGVKIIAPPTWMLVTLDAGRIVPSGRAREAKAAGLEILTWTIERSSPLTDGGGWYYRSITPAVTGEGAVLELIDVLAEDVGVRGIFSDWPATTTFYANCLGLD